MTPFEVAFRQYSAARKPGASWAIPMKKSYLYSQTFFLNDDGVVRECQSKHNKETYSLGDDRGNGFAQVVLVI